MFKFFALSAAILAIACIAPARSSETSDAHAEIRSLTNDIKEDGSYSYQFETTNGIAQQESGHGGHYATGSAAYYAPDGQLIQLSYTADENGFHPIGDHLPTPPPIPEAILKSLEYNRAHPEQEEEEHYHQHQHQHQQQHQQQHQHQHAQQHQQQQQQEYQYEQQQQQQQPQPQQQHKQYLQEQQYVPY